MLIVLPFYSGDSSALSSNLLWMKELDGKVPYECLLATDTETPTGRAVGFASQVFSKVHTFQYPRVKENHWPWPQNNSFMQTAWFIYGSKIKQPWLWVETDSIPLRSNWIAMIQAEYEKGKKPFGGHLNKDGIFNGVGVYPWNVCDFSQKAMTAALIRAPGNKQPPWDVYASPQILKHCHNINSLFQHVWDIDGKAATFPDQASVEKIIRPGVVLFHRNKDGTLIKRLRQKLRPRIPPPLPDEPIRMRLKDGVYHQTSIAEIKAEAKGQEPNPNWKSI